MADQATVTPHEAAQLVGTTVHSIRRWCAWHNAHLSPSAHPGTNAPRRLTPRDVEVLKAVRDLRLQGLATPAINDRLASMAFPDEAITESPQDLQESLGASHTALAVVDALQSVVAPLLAAQQAQDTRLQALEQGQKVLESQRPTWREVILLVLSALIVGVMIGLSIWWFQ
jgi:hypothetical protein